MLRRAEPAITSPQRAEMARRWRAGARVNLNLDLLNTVDIGDMYDMYGTYGDVGRYRYTSYFIFYQWDTDTL